VVLTIAGSILVTIPLKLVGTAAHQALLSILRWPLLYLALLLPLPVPIATATCQTSETITPPTARSLPSFSTIIVLAGAEINAETDIRPPATASATLKRLGARMADEIGQAKT